MKKIKYTNHLKYRIKLRGIPYEMPENILINADEFYHDDITNYNIALKKLKYKGKLREMIVTYEEIEETIDLITIHPIKPNEKENKIKQGRWIRI